MILRSRILLPYSSTFSQLGRGYTADVFPAVVYHLGLLPFSNYISSQGLLCCFCFTSVCEVVAEGECIETAFALFWHGCWRLVSGLFLLGMGAGDRWGINFSSGVGWKLAGSVFFLPWMWVLVTAQKWRSLASWEWIHFSVTSGWEIILILVTEIESEAPLALLSLLSSSDLRLTTPWLFICYMWQEEMIS